MAVSAPRSSSPTRQLPPVDGEAQPRALSSCRTLIWGVQKDGALVEGEGNASLGAAGDPQRSHASVRPIFRMRREVSRACALL